MAGGFVWHELVTSDAKAALRFYGEVVGWTSSEVPGGGGNPYVMLEANGRGMGGVFLKDDGMPTGWVGYLYSDDVDADAKKLTAAGAKVFRPPEDVPMAGRLSPMADPQGGGFILFKPKPPPGATPQTAVGQGTVAWNEYYATDLDKAVSFYREHFNFKPVRKTELGEAGAYHVLEAPHSHGGIGMMRKPRANIETGWVFYFNVDDIDAAAERVKRAGGSISQEPSEVPNGDKVWTLMAKDPQGGVFGLLGKKK